MEGTPFGRYRLVELLGRGGMGEVWRAYDTVTERMVALKVLPANLANDQMFQQRFRREAKAAAGVNNPHIIPIHDFGEIDGRLFVTMRLIEGRDLQAVLAAGALQPARAVAIIGQVANALHAAHKVGLVHRDVKPSNILIGEDDFAYLIDFGIARGAEETRMTGTGSVIGSWHYMSPERLRAGQVDARADIYALACVLYECLTGSPPYPGDNFEQQITAHLTAPPPRPSSTAPNVSAAFDRVIATGMAKDPDQRYATTVELARAAHDATTVPFPRPDQLTAAPIHGQATQWAATRAAPGPQPQPVPPPPWAQPSPKRPGWRRPRVVIAAVVATAVAIAAGIFAVVKLSSRPTTSEPAPAAAGPLDGTFTAEFSPATDLNDKPIEGSQPQQIWSIRSACPASGCVATASRVGVGDDKSKLLAMVFDEIDGRWLAVGVVQQKCGNVDTEVWVTYTLQLQPDRTLSGEQSIVTECGNQKAPVTFTRTGDVFPGVAVADPETQPPRVASPAQGLHGRYHGTMTFTSRAPQQEGDYGVRTDCLRSGDRCMNFFYRAEGFRLLVFANGKWTRNEEYDVPCSAGGTSHVKVTADFPLPQPPQDPITLLTGHGHEDQTAPCAGSWDFDDKYVRTGD